jgi:hypothetical protein
VRDCRVVIGKRFEDSLQHTVIYRVTFSLMISHGVATLITDNQPKHAIGW